MSKQFVWMKNCGTILPIADGYERPYFSQGY